MSKRIIKHLKSVKKNMSSHWKDSEISTKDTRSRLLPPLFRAAPQARLQYAIGTGMKRYNLYIYLALGFIIAVVSINLIYNYLTEKDIDSQIQNFLITSSKENDMKIETYLYDFLHDNLDRYLRSSSFSLFFEKKENDPDFFTSIRLSLIDSTKLNEYISNLILFRAKDNAVISVKDNGYSIKSLTSNYDSIQSILEMGKISKPYFYITADKTITYIYPVLNPNKWREGSYLGFAVTYLNNKDKFFYSNAAGYNPEGSFLILHGNQVPYAEGSNTLSDELVLNMIKNVPKEKIIKKKLSSLTYHYCFTTSSKGDLIYLYYEPEASFLRRLTYNQNYLVSYILSMLVVILCFLLRLVILRKNQEISLNKRQLSAQYADELMKSNHPTGAALVIQKFLSLEKQYPYYAVLIMEPDIIYLSDLTEKQKTFLYEEFRETAKKLFHSFALPNLVSLQLKGYISCIVNYDENYNSKELTLQLSEELKKYTKCTFNLFYTGSFTDASFASEAYKRLTELMKYSFIYNYSNTFLLEELEEIEKNPKVIEPKAIEIVSGYLNNLNQDNLIDYLNKTITSIRSNGYSHSQTTDYFNLVFCALKDFFIKKEFHYELDNIPITEQLNRFNTLEECVAFIETNVLAYKNSLFSAGTSANRRNMENILEFINNNIEIVTLSSVAEEFHVTSAHLSRLFKDNMGIKFSDYVSDIKLVKASELMKENTELSIIDIANKLGYNTPSYFSSKFRDKFGITPGMYKKAVMENK